MKSEFEYFNEVKRLYPKTMSKDQFYRVAHISKATALYLLQSGLVPCKDNGKKTCRYTIKTRDVIAYLEDRILNPQKYKASGSWYIGRSKPGRRETTEDYSLFTTMTPKQCEQLRRYFLDEMEELDDVLSIQQIAAFLGYSTSGIAYWCSQGHLKHFDISGKYMVPKPWLAEFLISEKSRATRRKSYQHRLFLADFANHYLK